MLNSGVRVKTDRTLKGATPDAVDDYLMDAATAGSNAMQDLVAAEATDTGQLLRSHVPPQREFDGSVITGFAADYAQWVDQGTRPHWPPIQPLLGWARRTLGDEDAAYAVQRKIAERGTEGIGITRRGLSAIRAWTTGHPLGDYLEDRL